MYGDLVYFLVFMVVGYCIFIISIDIAWNIDQLGKENKRMRTKEKKITLSNKYEYWKIADDLGYSLKCKDDIMHAEYESDIERILTTERKKVK